MTVSPLAPAAFPDLPQTIGKPGIGQKGIGAGLRILARCAPDDLANAAQGRQGLEPV